MGPGKRKNAAPIHAVSRGEPHWEGACGVPLRRDATEEHAKRAGLPHVVTADVTLKRSLLRNGAGEFHTRQRSAGFFLRTPFRRRRLIRYRLLTIQPHGVLY